MKKTLTDIIYQYKNSEFSWEKFDCCIFTVRVIEEYTNKTLPYWRDVISYKDALGAKKALKKLGCKDLKDLPNKILGTQIKPISEVKLGEPVYYINENGDGIMGVCNGKRSYFLQWGGGLTARDTKDCLYCWSIN